MTLLRTRSGLIFSDDFNRADSSSLGNGWVEDSGDWTISTNRLLGPSDNTATTRSVSKDLALSLTECFVQALWDSRNAADSASSLIHRGGIDILGPSGINGYRMRLSKLGDDLLLQRLDAGTATTIGTDTVGAAVLGLQEIQLYYTNSIQNARSGATGQGSLDGTDATHSIGAVSTRVRLNATHPAAGNSAARPLFDDVMVCYSKNIVVTGLPSGFKARVINSLSATVVTATESGGTATINCLRGSASEYVPFVGWSGVQVLNASDTIMDVSASGVYPGDIYDYAAAVEECPWTWEVVDGELPPGLILDEDTGDITGTPTEEGTYEFSYTESNCITTFTHSCQITIQPGDLQIGPTEIPDTTWLFNVGDFMSQKGLRWLKHTRKVSRMAVIDGRTLIFVGNKSLDEDEENFDPTEEENLVLTPDRSGAIVKSAFWTSPTLNQGPYLGQDLTVYRVIVIYEAGGVGMLDIQASGNGGLTWDRNSEQTSLTTNTNGKLARCHQGLNVTGSDLRIRIRFPFSRLIRIHKIICEFIPRGRL